MLTSLHLYNGTSYVYLHRYCRIVTRARDSEPRVITIVHISVWSVAGWWLSVVLPTLSLPCRSLVRARTRVPLARAALHGRASSAVQVEQP